jgi:hypothetical protein
MLLLLLLLLIPKRGTTTQLAKFVRVEKKKLPLPIAVNK